ncbi:NACHT domain-containing protein [Krasilnikovia sp. MM14-A1004]|uniref:NACHT domain-containing protein n=1 Tax=Krasilnikovia sp. MM14-A1004 TaxID=3373541 RepID=UPI00399CEEBA
MTTPAWVDLGDKAGSIVGAVTSVVSLGMSVMSLRRAGPSAPGPRGRGWLRLAVVLSALSITAFAVSWVWDRQRLGPIALGAGLTALGSLTVAAVLRGRAPKTLPEPVRALLAEQLGRAEQPRYDFGSLSPPSTPLIHVERQATTTDRRGLGGQVLTVAQMVRTARHAVVTGGPGVGKSTMVAHLVWEAGSWWLTARAWSLVRRAPYGSVVPVVVQARALLGADLPAALADTWQHIPAVDRDTFTRPPTPHTSWLVLVDSLDEVADPACRATVLRRLGAHLDTDRGRSRIIVATRPLGVEELGDLSAREVQAFQLRPFAREDVGRFAERWFTVRSGGGLYDPGEEAARFLSRIRAARLEPLVRVPLLCTMTALVYEADRDMRLPTSRAELYAEFIALLRRGRPAAADQDPLAEWLADHVDDLLAVMATAVCRADDRRLIEVATEWVRAKAPADLAAGPQSGWVNTVRSQLIVSGLCSVRSTNVEFVHHSVAEYLAADPRLSLFDPDGCQADLLDPARRSRALFLLARSGEAADPLVERLIAVAPSAAGFIVADGIPVAPALRRRTVDALLAALQTDDTGAPDCLAVLAALGTDDEIRARLERVTADPAEGVWVRATVADALADLGFEAGTAALRELAEQRSVVGQWAGVRLAARTGRVPDRPSRPAEVDDLSRIGPLGRRALAAVAADRRAPAADRLEAASALYRLHDDTGRDMLRELVRDAPQVPADVRRLAAIALDGGGDPIGRTVLRQLARPATDAAPVPPRVRRQAAVALTERGDAAGADALWAMVEDRDVPREEWLAVRTALAEIGEMPAPETDNPWSRRLTHGPLRSVVPLVAAATALALSRAAQVRWAEVGVLVAGAVALSGLVMVVLARRRRTPAPSESTRRALSMLAEAVTRQWSAEAASRDLDLQHLQVRWPARGRDRRQPPASRRFGSTADIVDAFQRLPRRHLLILGGPGAGKTTVAIGMLLGLAEVRASDDPVPVFLWLARWDPRESNLVDWVAGQLVESYPFLGPSARARELVESGRILPILDGLDEMPEASRHDAAYKIWDLARRGLSLVVTSRPQATSPVRRLPTAELEPFSAVEIVAGMTRGLPPSVQDRWQPVLTEIHEHPGGSLARALSTPLLVSLARTVYADAGSNPVELLDHSRFDRPAAIESRLIDRFIPAAYRHHPRSGRWLWAAERWLSFLATVLDQQGTREFAWWRLPGAVPLTQRRLLTGSVLGLACGLPLAMDGGAVLLPLGFGVGMMVASLGVRDSPPLTVSRFVSTHDFATGLRRERRRAWGLAAGFAGAVVAAYALLGSYRDGLGVAAMCMAFALVQSTWGQWLMARVVLAAAGRLPWRLVHFLADAADRGVLREAGPFYRFRHFRLQERLSRRWEKPRR